jgi:hypothetical protein
MRQLSRRLGMHLRCHQFRISVRLLRVFIHSAGPGAPNQSPDPSPRLNLLILNKFLHQAGSLPWRPAEPTVSLPEGRPK